MKNSEISRFFKVIFALFFAGCLVCATALAEISSCSSALTAATMRTTAINDPVYKFRLSIAVTNSGSAVANAQIFTYSQSTGTQEDSSAVTQIGAGQTVSLYAKMKSCTAIVKLTMTSSSANSASNCSSTVTINSSCCNNCSTPTPTPTPTPSPQPPVCNAGGPYTGLDCSAAPVSLRLNGSNSSGSSLSYTWFSNCPYAVFDNMYSATPIMQLPTIPQDPNALSYNCTAYLMVRDANNLTSTCSALLSSRTCNRDCKGVINGSAKPDACGTCGGTVSDPTQCNVINQCVKVEASDDILAYEQRLIKQAKSLVKKFNEENKRNKKNNCGINTAASSKEVQSAFEVIKDAGNDIFSQGVEICNNSCVTVSYADQVTELLPEFKVIESNATSLAKQVQACYKRKHIRTDQRIPGVKTTVKVVKSELTKLIKDCKDNKVCR